MKITMQVPQEGPNVSRRRGDEIEVDDAEGQRLVDATFALEGWTTEQVKPALTPAPKKPVSRKG